MSKTPKEMSNREYGRLKDLMFEQTALGSTPCFDIALLEKAKAELGFKSRTTITRGGQKLGIHIDVRYRKFKLIGDPALVQLSNDTLQKLWDVTFPKQSTLKRGF